MVVHFIHNYSWVSYSIIKHFTNCAKIRQSVKHTFCNFAFHFTFFFFAFFYFVTKIPVVNTFTHFSPICAVVLKSWKAHIKFFKISSNMTLDNFSFFQALWSKFQNGQYKNWNSIIQTSTITYNLDSNTTCCSNLWSKLKIFLWQKIKFDHVRGKNLKVHKFTREWP